jgi:hypothetical protein
MSAAARQGWSAFKRFQRGFTIVSLTVTTLTTGIMIAGAWMTVASCQRQWHIANAERMMDQYGHSVMKELTNDLSWAWGAQQISGGLHPRWRIYMDDVINENGGMDRWTYRRDGMVNGKKYIVLSHSATAGILINDVPPKWAGDLYRKYYLWSGTQPGPGVSTTKSFDQRDRMTVEGLQIEFNPHASYPIDPSDVNARIIRNNTVKIRMVMHYTYAGASQGDWGLYGNQYVRERVFETQVSLRNWDVERNLYRDDLLAEG